jgi:uncharacterized protein (TIGR03086 family)
MTAQPREMLATALARAETVVAAIGPDEWALSTPCTEWTVRAVVNHLVGGNLLLARLLEGEQLPAREELVAASRNDRLGDDPVGAYRSAAERLLAAFRAGGVLERTVTVPAGPVPGIAALYLRIVEALVHGWDVARATGRDIRFPEDLVEEALAFTRVKLADLGHRVEGQGPFGPPQPVADDAPAIDRLAALLGREIPAGDVRTDA